jgi:4-hydroxy-4-methyl-2-oxoglutarate aldolase
MGKIVSRIQRPPPGLIARYARLALPRVVSIMAEPVLMDGAIKPLYLRRLTLCGPAVTVQSSGADLMMGVLATGVAQAGDVVVVTTGGDYEHACWGGGLTLSADNAGYAGVVLDGVVEDSDAILQRRTPIFCRGTATRKLPQDGRSGSINVDINCGGVTVRPGDLIMGDTDGVIVIPQDQLESLIEQAEAAHADTLAKIASVEAAGAILFDRWGGQDLVKRLGIDWVE